LNVQTTHRYHANSFKLHRLPIPRYGTVLGLIGANGVGKSTALKILSGNIKPNLGRFDDPPSWQEIIKYFRGSDLQNFFTKMVEEKFTSAMKPQHVYLLSKLDKQNVVGDFLQCEDELRRQQVISTLELEKLLDRKLQVLSGGELQRVAIAHTCLKKADIHIFDEPSSFLDISQRMKASNLIRSLADVSKNQKEQILLKQEEGKKKKKLTQ
jgi:ATP-binding cassette subfamily E protein 1